MALDASFLGRGLERLQLVERQQHALVLTTPFHLLSHSFGVPHTPPPQALSFDPTKSFGETRKEHENAFEHDYVEWLLGRHHGNLSRAAREARMDRKHLRELARRHMLRVQETDADEIKGDETHASDAALPRGREVDE